MSASPSGTFLGPQLSNCNKLQRSLAFHGISSCSKQDTQIRSSKCALQSFEDLCLPVSGKAVSSI